MSLSRNLTAWKCPVVQHLPWRRKYRPSLRYCRGQRLSRLCNRLYPINRIPFNHHSPEENGGKEDIFISKLDFGGDNLLFSTVLGGDSIDCGYSIALDSMNNIYIAGETKSSNLNITNGYQIHLTAAVIFT